MSTAPSLKEKVRDHWEVETCGTRYGESSDRASYFDEISQTRYRLEPYIKPFAAFPDARGKSILEIGVGAGSDFEQWCSHARHCTGVDLTQAGVDLTRERLQLRGTPEDRYTLKVADAENLPFEGDSFDLVYSWGVLHHTPDTERAFSEAYRVLRPGGTLKAMIYHVPSWVGLMLAIKYMIAHRTIKVGMRKAIYEDLESPGTKAYYIRDARRMLTALGFRISRLEAKLSMGDLMTLDLSRKNDNMWSRIAMKLYPRSIVRLMGDRFGLGLLIECQKPIN